MTNGGSITPGRDKFANRDELIAYLGQTLGGRPDGDGIRGSLSRKGAYSRQTTDGAPAVTFGDPVLDAISSAEGQLVVGAQTFDFTADDGPGVAPRGTGSGVVVYDAPYLKFTGMVNGAERWASDDKALVEYRMGTGRLDFQAWRETTYYELHWALGALVSVIDTNANFQGAAIQAHYYMSVHGPCEVVGQQYGTHRDDNYFDESIWGVVVIGQEPERVAALCQAVWHRQRFADLVTAGDGCMNYLDDQWETGFPSDWRTINTQAQLNGVWTDGTTRKAVISTEFSLISVDMSAFNRPTASGSIVDYSSIKVTFPDDATYTGTLHPNKIVWSNGSVWTKVINTVMDLNGGWSDGGPRIAVFSEGATSLKIDMSDYDRPMATGSIVNGSTIKVTFPDAATYTGSLQAPNKILWSNGSAWTKV
jgi:hypothetical protein